MNVAALVLYERDCCFLGPSRPLFYFLAPIKAVGPDGEEMRPGPQGVPPNDYTGHSPSGLT